MVSQAVEMWPERAESWDSAEEKLNMWKKKERWTAAALLLAMVVVTGLCWYILYIRQQFYDEGTRNLLETYEQVDKSFPSSLGATGTC